MNYGTVFNIQKFCLHDGDGIRTCVFLKGCPLRCIWCHNPESLDKEPVLSFDSSKCSLCSRCVNICQHRYIKNNMMLIDRNKCNTCGRCIEECLNDANEIIGKKMSVSDVIDEVIKDKIFYDSSGGGLTITGGEPSYQSDFTLELLEAANKRNISTAIETCGIGTSEFYKAAADLNTTFLFDIKCINSDLHLKLTGSDNTHIISNLNLLMERNADIIIRIPLIPDCNDSDTDIRLLAEFLKNNNEKFRYAEIMPYHSLGISKYHKLGKTAGYDGKTATKEEITRWKNLFNLYGININVSE